ncbi:hypothetical protein DPX16_3769 [Anabarilius grahami]|uniref:Uncharacterized protein n=1 Tax=Anabarilius grahami TaxID=495550 RepID=A0A3N0XZN0_ANAGA|nr:hypothetical protein DPX16_3769 [Anabarilius grahami]
MPDPEPSQPSAMPTVKEPEPTTDPKPDPTTKQESEQQPEATFVASLLFEPDSNAESVQVCELT